MRRRTHANSQCPWVVVLVRGLLGEGTRITALLSPGKGGRAWPLPFSITSQYRGKNVLPLKLALALSMEEGFPVGFDFFQSQMTSCPKDNGCRYKRMFYECVSGTVPCTSGMRTIKVCIWQSSNPSAQGHGSEQWQKLTRTATCSPVSATPSSLGAAPQISSSLQGAEPCMHFTPFPSFVVVFARAPFLPHPTCLPVWFPCADHGSCLQGRVLWILSPPLSK